MDLDRGGPAAHRAAVASGMVAADRGTAAATARMEHLLSQARRGQQELLARYDTRKAPCSADIALAAWINSGSPIAMSQTATADQSQSAARAAIAEIALAAGLPSPDRSDRLGRSDRSDRSGDDEKLDTGREDRAPNGPRGPAVGAAILEPTEHRPTAAWQMSAVGGVPSGGCPLASYSDRADTSSTASDEDAYSHNRYAQELLLGAAGSSGGDEGFPAGAASVEPVARR